MIKEALEYVAGLTKPTVFDFKNGTYTDKRVNRVDDCLRAEAIKFRTLSSVVTYIKDNPDKLTGKLLVHVESPTCVTVMSTLDNDRKRETNIIAKADLPEFAFGRFIDSEAFVIALRAQFVQNADTELVLQFAGTAETGTVAKYGDDGVSQKVTIKTGITQTADDIVPNPVRLRPYRTFLEVDQPESDFIFRMKDSERCINCALYEADGGAWKNEAMNNVKEYLERELKDCNVLVIS